MIVISYGSDIVKSTYSALEASDICFYLKPDFDVALKPNLVVPGPASGGAVTHPEVVEGVILFLRDYGVKKIKIIESSWVGDCTKQAFRDCGYINLSEKYDIPLVDLKDDSYTVRNNIKICDLALNADFLINIPVLKAHCQTLLTCCMKNLKGCIPDSEKRRFHTINLHKAIAELNAALKTGYNVVDGICGDLTFEEGGNPVESNRIIAGRNPLLVDSFCAEIIGCKPDEIEHLHYGKKMGVGEYYSSETKIVELNAQNKPVRELKNTRTADRYKKIINEDAACSACYSSLIYALHKLGGKVNGNVCIGQGFKGKSGSGTGIGNCTRGFSRHISGCPPKAADIVDFLS